MSQLITLEQLLEQGQTRQADICHSIQSCLEQSEGLELEWGTPEVWRSDHPALAQLACSGLVIVLTGEPEAFLLVLPETLPLPDWYRQPNDTEQSRLQTLAQEVAFLCVPESFQQGQEETVLAHDLATAIAWSSPLESAQIVEIKASWSLAANEEGEASSENAASPASLWLIGPVETPPVSAEDQNEAELAEEQRFADEESAAEYSAPSLVADPHTDELIARVRRLMKLNVKVSVRLAEMKIELSTLANLCPGTLLVFPKSCDDLLDLYVNNQLYAQGEAVKIGEKFGLKVNQVGTQKVRKSGVFSL